MTVPPDPAGSHDPLVPLGVGQWWGRTFGVLRRSGPVMVGVQLLGLAPALVFMAAGSLGVAVPVSALTPGLMVCAVPWVLGHALSVHIAVRQAAGRPLDASGVLRRVRRRALPVLGWSLVGAVGAALLGGLMFVAALGCTVVVERAGIRRALTLTDGRTWSMVGSMLVLQGAALAYVIVLIHLLPPVPGSLDPLFHLLLVLPVSLVFVAASVVTYAGLRHREDPAVHAATLAAELER